MSHVFTCTTAIRYRRKGLLLRNSLIHHTFYVRASDCHEHLPNTNGGIQTGGATASSRSTAHPLTVPLISEWLLGWWCASNFPAIPWVRALPCQSVALYFPICKNEHPGVHPWHFPYADPCLLPSFLSNKEITSPEASSSCVVLPVLSLLYSVPTSRKRN